MPFYDFVCKECNAKFSELCSWAERNDMACKECGAKGLDKPLTTPAGHRCYGEGFYAPSLKMEL